MCNIYINNIVQGNPISGGTQVTIHGGATGCKNVDVKIKCGDVWYTNTNSAVVNSTNHWTTSFITKCPCGSDIEVYAACSNNPQCNATHNTTIQCPSPVDCCPKLTINNPVFGNCDPVTNTIPVTINYQITGPTNNQCEHSNFQGTLTFSNSGHPPTIVTINFPWNGTQTGSVALSLTPSTILYIELKLVPSHLWAECLPINLQYNVPPCNNNDCCPTLNLVLGKFGDCDGNNKRYTSITYTINPKPNCPVINGTLTFPGGSIVIANSSPLSGSIPLNLPAGSNNTITLSLTSPPHCLNEQRFKVPPCEDCCPNAVAVIKSNTEEAECTDDNLAKTIKIEAIITPTPKQGCPSNVTADMYIDDTYVETGSGSGPFTVTHSGDYGCGKHSVTIKYRDSGCPDYGDEFCVSVCESTKCFDWRTLFQIAASTAIISWVIFLCLSLNSTVLSSNPAIGAIQTVSIITSIFFLAVISTILWIIFWMYWRKIPCKKTCKKCRTLLNSWQIALASFLGFVILSKCSFIGLYLWLSQLIGPPYGPLIAIIIIILIVLIWIIIILILYFQWIAKCCPTECEKWTLFFEALLMICGPAYGLVLSVITAANSAAPASFWILPFGLPVVIWALFTAWVNSKRKAACK